MRSRIPVFVLILLAYLGLSAFIGWSGLQYWNVVMPAAPDALFIFVYVLLAFSYLIAMLARRAMPYALYKALKVIGSYGIGLLFYAVLLVPLADLTAWLLILMGTDASVAVTVVGSAVLAVMAVLLLVGSWNAWNPIVRRYDIEIAKPGGGRKELRIAAASDLHLGTMVGKRHLSRLTERVASLAPDLILLPGDVLDDSIEPFVRENMAEVMSGLRAPLGVYAVLGNHEYIGGHIAEYVERMRAIGIDVLLDRVVEFEDGLYVAGRKDHAVESFTNEGRLTVDALLESSNVDRSKPIILMDHQPHQLGAAAEAGVDLMLSGHTHRGQMMPNHLITRRLFELDWGYLRKGVMHAIVSSGFGSWGPPLRIGSRSELLDIRVTFQG
ncbi:metallophosphoesterase [Paenibacillus validus]|uniref:metallophosphoesterase n=1 Tax=Paenibacillus validus TaxID=44253 RepID=UPI000FD915E2|nr:metallophosphoesterase [Paenibacillus validus]MED4602060.1 metallophosphoesterase [Paenibacillus validus]MED4607576.1 metallophosphoesterase [Paenibacillus validus]